jgi:hypothetical protein
MLSRGTCGIELPELGVAEKPHASPGLSPAQEVTHSSHGETRLSSTEFRGAAGQTAEFRWPLLQDMTQGRHTGLCWHPEDSACWTPQIYSGQ